MERGSKLDQELFNRYVNRQDELRSIAIEIRKVAGDNKLRVKISQVEDEDIDSDSGVLEGQTLYRLHKVFERDRMIVKRKKDSALSKNGRIACEACDLVFGKFYGELGAGYIECHHKMPLAKLRVETKTTLESLALVCSNCHRMLHRRIDTLSVEELRTIIANNRS